MCCHVPDRSFFFFNDTATTEIYTLSLHDALPICVHDGARDRRGATARSRGGCPRLPGEADQPARGPREEQALGRDRKSTRLNSSHLVISYAVFCLEKKKETLNDETRATIGGTITA